MSETIIQDPVFGILTWDEQLNWWSGKAELAPGYELRVYIESTLHEGNERTRDFAHAHRLWAILSETEEELRARAAEEEFWGIYDDWRDGVYPPAPKLDLRGFVEVFKLQSVSFFCDGCAELFLDDALVVFGGHALHFFIDENGKYESGSTMFAG